MIAEQNLLNNNNHQLSISNAKLVLTINKLMVETIANFKSYLNSDFHKKKNLNENELTQFYTKQAQILIREKDYPFNVECEYKDAYNLSKGFSDFFFYTNEQNVSAQSIFSVESKRLPAPEKSRKKEYIIGNKNNGGIERYKIEMHGKGLDKCGLLGFIEIEDSTYWLREINSWIEDLAKVDNFWKKDEVLSNIETNSEYIILESIAHRKSDKVQLFHLWVKLN